MRCETIEEIKKFTPPAKHPSPFATPIVAMVIAGVVGITAIYADYTRGNLFEELDKNKNVGDFKQLVKASTLEQSFAEDEWEYTVVAPSNQAFDKAQWQSEQDNVLRVGQQTFDDFPSMAPAYTGISAYDYVTSSPIYPDDVKFGEHIRIPSLSGQDIVFSRVSDGPNGLRVNGLRVSTVEKADNGVIYTIDEMIIFPELQQRYSWTQD